MKIHFEIEISPEEFRAILTGVNITPLDNIEIKPSIVNQYPAKKGLIEIEKNPQKPTKDEKLEKERKYKRDWYHRNKAKLKEKKAAASQPVVKPESPNENKVPPEPPGRATITLKCGERACQYRECRKPFKPTKPDQIYCSPTCAQKASIAMGKPPKMI